jgi:hypothetical protein
MGYHAHNISGDGFILMLANGYAFRKIDEK